MASSDPEEPRLACWKTFVPRQETIFVGLFWTWTKMFYGGKNGDDFVMGKINGHAVSYETISRFLHWLKAFREIQVGELIFTPRPRLGKYILYIPAPSKRCALHGSVSGCQFTIP